jgi:hypothetical protein
MAKHAVNHSLRRVLVLALAAAALLALPASADAAFAQLDATGKLVYTTVPGEANDITVTYTSAGVAKLTEAGRLGPFPILIAGSGGCSGLAAQITCRGTTSLDIRSGDGSDRVSARNGTADKISCGSGTDSVVADPQDSVAADCESVDRGTTVIAPSGGGASADPATGTPPSPPVGGDAGHSGLNEQDPLVNVAPPVIPAQTVSVSTSGVAAVRVACPADAGTCRGTVALVLVRATAKRSARVVAAAGAGPKGITLGSTKFTAKGGTKPVVPIRLNRRGRQRILRTRHTRCKIVVTTRAADGKTVTTTRSITLRPRRTVSRSHK